MATPEDICLLIGIRNIVMCVSVITDVQKQTTLASLKRVLVQTGAQDKPGC